MIGRRLPVAPRALRKLSIAVAIGLPALTAALPARAADDNQIQQQAVRSYNIPAQPLGDALNAFIAVSDWQVGFPAAITKNLRSTAINGSYTPQQALQKLLNGSGLSYRFTGASAVTLEKPATPLPDSALPAVTVNASAAASNAFAEPEDRIHYNLPSASSAMKTDTPIMETPESIQVVPRALMDDQQVISVEDALKNVTGVQSFQDFYVNPMIRGFTGDSSTFRNGLREDSVSFVETANLARMEVVKGPGSALYGRLPAGGLVDLITYRPQEDAHYSLQQQFGSFSTYRTVLDATGPVLDNKSVLYRLNFAYKANNSFRDYVSADHIFVMPSLTWRPTDAFETNVNMEYQNDNFISDPGVVGYGTAPLKLPVSQYVSDGTAMQNYPSSQNRVLAAFDWTYHFNADWKLTNRFKYQGVNYSQNFFVSRNMLSPNMLQSKISTLSQNRTSYATNLDLTGNFDTGFIHHSALLGYDLYYLDQHGGPGVSRISPLLPPSNVYSPYQAAVNIEAVGPLNVSNKYVQYWNGIYIQDEMTLWDTLHVLAGGRWDNVGEGFGAGGGQPLNTIDVPRSHANVFKPRFGLLYQPVEWASLYANYIESIGLDNGLAANGQSFQPETATQYEVGAKAEFFDKRLMTTLAFYNITKNNALTTDPNNTLYAIAIGQQRNKGMEFTVQGELTKNISLIAGYTYIDAKITRDNDGYQGKTAPNVPLNSGNIWTKYAFDNDVLPGVSLGTGIYLQGQRQGDLGNTFQLPGYARWDASASYSFEQFGGKFTTQLNVYNILNQIYYANAIGNIVNIIPGAPLTLLGSVRLEF